MNVVELYRKIKQVLNDSNIALTEKGLGEVGSLSDIPSEIEKLEINRLPYLLRKEITEVTESDLDGCTTIRSHAFYSYKSLSSITIPNCVTTIKQNAFYGCTSLTNMYLYPTTPPALADANAISTATTVIHVPIGCGETYRTATNWSTFADIIAEDIII